MASDHLEPDASHTRHIAHAQRQNQELRAKLAFIRGQCEEALKATALPIPAVEPETEWRELLEWLNLRAKCGCADRALAFYHVIDWIKYRRHTREGCGHETETDSETA